MTKAENKIKELETEIAELKKEHEIEKRIEHIVALAKERKQSKEEEDMNLYHQWESMEDKIYTLAYDRIVTILRLSKALKENGFELPEEWWCRDNSDTNGIKFVGLTEEAIVLKKDGTYCDVSLEEISYNNKDTEYYCNVYTEYYHDRQCESIDESISLLKKSIMAMELFIADFDRFEKAFYDYLDSLGV